MRFSKMPDGGDPSAVHQQFQHINITLLCLRYWWIETWDFPNLAFPYWRLYWNKNAGASMSFRGEKHTMTPDKIFLVAPNTPYSTRIENVARKETDNVLLAGAPVGEDVHEEAIMAGGSIFHLFAHFNLGFPHDFVPPQILMFNLDPVLENLLGKIIPIAKGEHKIFDRSASLMIYALITELLGRIPEEQWPSSPPDYRVKDAIMFIENNLHTDISNTVLAKNACMATNAFGRLFSHSMGYPPRRYILKRRVEKACVLLHHSTKTIDIIAKECGFCDRYYFSKAFKKETGRSPAAYRNEFPV